MPIWASANYADPHSFIGEMYDSTRGGSYATCSYFKDAAVDDLLAKAYVSQDKGERAKLYAEAAEKVVEGSPTLFIYNEKWMGARAKRVKNYAFSPIGAGNFLMSVSLED